MLVLKDKTGMTNDILANYLTEDEFAAAVRRDKRTLRRWHARREGPPRVKAGSRILYPKDGVRRWLESKTVEPVGATQ